MLKIWTAAAIVGCTLLATPAFSQTAQSEWRTSKLIGANVYNNKNEKIGDIDELLSDKTGKIQAAILGVGGFLGMGEHYVSVKFDELKWVNEPAPAATTSNTDARTQKSMNQVLPTTTGSGIKTTEANRMYPDHALLTATKDQLKAMPEFKYPK
jgi:sporulation protein YlmC with PRC-barrel domain